MLCPWKLEDVKIQDNFWDHSNSRDRHRYQSISLGKVSLPEGTRAIWLSLNPKDHYSCDCLLFSFSHNAVFWVKIIPSRTWSGTLPQPLLPISLVNGNYWMPIALTNMIIYSRAPIDFLASTLKCQSLSRVQLFATPWTVAHQTSLSITISWILLKLMAIESVIPFNHLGWVHTNPFQKCLPMFGDSWSLPLNKW